MRCNDLCSTNDFRTRSIKNGKFQCEKRPRTLHFFLCLWVRLQMLKTGGIGVDQGGMGLLSTRRLRPSGAVPKTSNEKSNFPDGKTRRLSSGKIRSLFRLPFASMAETRAVFQRLSSKSSALIGTTANCFGNRPPPLHNRIRRPIPPAGSLRPLRARTASIFTHTSARAASFAMR